MYSKLWKIGKMLLVVLVLLTANIGCAPVKGEDKMTNVEWSAFYMNRNHQFRTLCYRFEVNYDPFKEGQATFSCFFVDKKGDNCLLSSAKVTSEDLAELDAFIQSLKTVSKVEILPYHTLGVFKWKELGLKYQLEGIQPPDAESIAKAKEILASEQ